MKSDLELYQTMVTIRVLEDQLQELCNRGEAGDLHFNKGQEAVSVGVCAALSPKDRMVTHHRTIAHQIARGAELYPLVAELLGKKTGVCGGQAGEMHITDPKIRHDFSFQIIGTCVPVAAGLAWTLKNHHKNDEIVAVFFGDASTSNGQFHEGMNQIALHQLPVLLICENNHLAGNIRPKNYLPMSPKVRAESYGMTSFSADGNDIQNVVETTRVAISSIKTLGIPAFIEFDTTRLCWHKQGQRDIRSAEEIAVEAKRDPILALQKKLTAGGLTQLSELSAIQEHTKTFVADTIKRAQADSPPEVLRD